MKLKRFALRGLIILAVVLTLCAFFSGTIRTITTPKVQFTQPRNGKLQEKLMLNGTVYFPKTEKITLTLPEDVTLTILRVNTKPGYTADAGTSLIEAEVTGYSEKIASLTKEYETAESSLSALERKNADIRVRPADENYLHAQNAYKAARSASVLARVALDTCLARENITMGEDGSLPDYASEELRAAASAADEAQKQLSDAQLAWERAKRYSIDETIYTYLVEKTELQEKMRTAEEKIGVLTETNAAVAQIQAPHDAYVAAIHVAENDVWDGKKPLLEITAKKADPVLRADITDQKRTISKNAEVEIPSRWSVVESRVLEVVTDVDGRKYAHIAINKDVLSDVGSVYSLLSNTSGKEMTINYQAKNATCLVPVSAVHGSGDDRYVFLVYTEESTFGSKKTTVRKTSVTVEAEVDGVASLREDLWGTIAYMEDRAIEDGMTVMGYTK